MTDRRSVFVDDQPDSRAPPQPIDAPVSSGDILGAHWTLGRQDFPGAPDQAKMDAYGPIITELTKRDPQTWLGPDATPYVQVGAAQPINEDAVWRAVSKYRAQDPAFLKDVPASSPAEFSAWVQQQELNRRHAAQNVVSRESGFGQKALGFAADAGTQAVNPANLALLALGGPVAGASESLAGIMAREALLNASAETLNLPAQVANRSQFGESTTAGEMVADVAMAGTTGAVFGAAGHTIASIAKRFGKGQLTGPEVAQTFVDHVPEDARTPDERAALAVIGRQAEIDAANPFEHNVAGLDAHAHNLDFAQAGLAGAPLPTPPSSIGLTQDRIINFVLHDLEGGAKVVHFGRADGGTTKFGIAAADNPGVDVANLTADQAAGIARAKYWFPELNSADPRTAAVAFDAGYISGPAAGRRILQESGGDPARALELYREHLNHIADVVPGKAKFRKGWNARVDRLAAMVDEGGRDTLQLSQAATDDEIGQGAAQAEINADQLQATPTPASASIADVPALEDEPASAAVSPPSAAEVLDAVRSYVSSTRQSLAPERIASALDIDAGQASEALSNLAGRPNAAVVIAGNGQFRRAPVDRGPVDMIRFLARQGGIRDDEGHALIAGRNMQQMVPGVGKLIRDDGMSLDRARETAAEAGYFHDMAPQDAVSGTTEADFLDLLEHARSTKHYALEDLAAADQQAADRELAEGLKHAAAPIGEVLDDRGIRFGREQKRRAAWHAHVGGADPEEAVSRVIREDMQDALDAAASETEDWRYEYLADDFEQSLGRNARSATPGHEGSAPDARNPRTGGGGVEGMGGALRDQREAAGLEGPPSADLAAGKAFDDPAGAGLRQINESLDHDLRMLAERGDLSPFRIDEDSAERPVHEILAEIEADDAAIEAARRCL